jgi:DNA polymerase-1
VNTIIQGTAADLVKIAMRRVWDRLARERSSAKLLLQVHDELLLEVPVGESERVVRLVTEEMEVTLLDVPLRVNIATGHNWNEAHG